MRDRRFGAHETLRGTKVYLAAPYTSAAIPGPSDVATPTLIRSAGYRNWLTGIADALGDVGYRVLLPHRDISSWGESATDISTVAEKCIAAVRQSDALVALAARSFGSHVEVGVALGASVPVVLVSAPDAPLSEFASGLAASRLVTDVRIDRLDPGVPDLERAVVVAERVASALDASKSGAGRDCA